MGTSHDPHEVLRSQFLLGSGTGGSWLGETDSSKTPIVILYHLHNHRNYHLVRRGEGARGYVTWHQNCFNEKTDYNYSFDFVNFDFVKIKTACHGLISLLTFTINYN